MSDNAAAQQPANVDADPADATVVQDAFAKGRARKAETQARAVVNKLRNQQQARDIITLETAARICPTAGVATKISTVYALPPVDYPAIRQATEDSLAQAAKALTDNLNDKALEMHMQRIVDGFVRSANGAGNFYDKRTQLARDLSSKVASQHRDEDRPGIDNTANAAERACSFAAIMGLQAYALLAAAHGAIDAYAQVCGQDWKPYEGMAGATLSRQALSYQVGAFS